MTHLDPDTLAAFVHGGATEAQRASVDAHLDGCDACLAVIGELTRARRAAAPGRYLLLRPLGAGAMGTVHAAYDRQLDRTIALKRIRGHASAERRARLMREAQTMARLEHPHVARVYDVSEDAEGLFLTMQLVEGHNLREWLRESPRGWREVLEVLLRAGEGLATAHAQGILHRDFKPENVLLGRDGTVLVTDFGLARSLDEGDLTAAERAPASAPTTLTQTGAMLGTPVYLSPEQHRGESADAKSDQFAFAVTAFEALGGQRPFAAKTLEGLKAAVLEGRPGPWGRPVPKAVRRVVEKALAVAPANRFDGMPALLSALRAAANARRTRVLAAGAVLLAVALVAVGFGASRLPESSCADAPPALESLWSPEVRRDVRAHVDAQTASWAKEGWVRLDAAFVTFISQWTTQRADACAATHAQHTQSDTLLDRRLACLDRRLLEASALAGVLRSGGEPVKPSQVEDALRRVKECADTAVLLVDSGAERPPPELEQRLADVRARVATGRNVEARSLAESLVATFDGGAPTALDVEAALELGDLQRTTGELSKAQATATQTVLLAERLGSDALLTEAWLALALAHGTQGHTDELAAALGHVDALAARVPLRPAIHVLHRRTRGTLLYNQGRFTELVPVVQAAIDLERATVGPEGSEQLGRMHAQLGQALTRVDQSERADAAYREAERLLKRVLGPEHPELTFVYRRWAESSMEWGLMNESAGHARRVLELSERAGISKSVDRTIALHVIADTTMNRLAPRAEVRAGIEGERAAVTEIWGPESPYLAPLSLLEGVDQLWRGETKAGLASIDGAIALARSKPIYGTYMVDTFLREKAGVLLDQGEPKAALAALDETSDPKAAANEAHRWRARGHLGERDAALAALRALLQAEPPEAHTTRSGRAQLRCRIAELEVLSKDERAQGLAAAAESAKVLRDAGSEGLAVQCERSVTRAAR